MKKTLLIAFVCTLVLGLFSNCGDNGPQGANLFIEKSITTENDLYDYTLIMVKYLEPNENAGSGPNIINKCLGTTMIGGYEYYMFRVPRRELDIYIEAQFQFVGEGAAFENSGTRNRRRRVNLKVNDWARLYLPDHNGHLYEVMDGSGEIY